MLGLRSGEAKSCSSTSGSLCDYDRSSAAGSRTAATSIRSVARLLLRGSAAPRRCFSTTTVSIRCDPVSHGNTYGPRMPRMNVRVVSNFIVPACVTSRSRVCDVSRPAPSAMSTIVSTGSEDYVASDDVSVRSTSATRRDPRRRARQAGHRLTYHARRSPSPLPLRPGSALPGHLAGKGTPAGSRACRLSRPVARTIGYFEALLTEHTTGELPRPETAAGLTSPQVRGSSENLRSSGTWCGTPAGHIPAAVGCTDAFCSKRLVTRWRSTGRRASG